MAWVQLFPTNATRISQSVAQIQANWLFIQQNINTDHYFNSGAPNEGHHKFMHLPTQGADPAVILTGIVYQKNNASARPRLYYRTAAIGGFTRIEQIPTAITGRKVLAAGAGTNTILNFAGQPAFQGFFSAYQAGTTGNRCCAAIFFDGVTLKTTQLGRHGIITEVTHAAANLQVKKTAGASTLTYSIMKTEY